MDLEHSDSKKNILNNNNTNPINFKTPEKINKFQKNNNNNIITTNNKEKNNLEIDNIFNEKNINTNPEKNINNIFLLNIEEF